MNDIDKLSQLQFIFGSLFLISNKLQVLGDNHLSQDDITIKQWFLTLIISQFKSSNPTLSEVSEAMGTSRQNVKQLALKLQEKGFLVIEKDKRDTRALRLSLTEKNQPFWNERQEKNNSFILELFNNLNKDEIDSIYSGFNKIYENINDMNEK